MLLTSLRLILGYADLLEKARSLSVAGFLTLPRDSGCRPFAWMMENAEKRA